MGKEVQNKGMVVNHLQMSHYHLGLICSQCLEYFTTSTDTVPSLAAVQASMARIDDDNDDQEEESDINDNGKYDDDLAFA